MATLIVKDPTPQSKIVNAVVIAGLAAAALDAGYFSTTAVLNGHTPVRVLRGIAAFWLGPRALDLGATSAVIGASTHLALATLMAAGFVVAARQAKLFRQSVIAGGLAYGMLLYLIMYCVVMPLRWPALFPRWDGWRSVFDIVVHLAIGLMFALILRKHIAGEAA